MLKFIPCLRLAPFAIVTIAQFLYKQLLAKSWKNSCLLDLFLPSLYKRKCAYLSNRTQYLVFSSCNSSERTIAHGVPQGSILGTILFLLYINDIVNASSLSFTVYSDDTYCYASIIDLININSEMRNIRCMILNKLTLNVDKTNNIIFHRNKDMPPVFPITTVNVPIKRIMHTKFLGIHMDFQLNWKTHKQCSI